MSPINYEPAAERKIKLIKNILTNRLYSPESKLYRLLAKKFKTWSVSDLQGLDTLLKQNI